MKKERKILELQNKAKVNIELYICRDKNEVQSIVKNYLGYLSSDCTECAWEIENGMAIAIRYNSSLGRIAHEMAHAAVAICAKIGMDSSSYALIHNPEEDFAYIPAEVFADLCEQIMDNIVNLSRQ